MSTGQCPRPLGASSAILVLLAGLSALDVLAIGLVLPSIPAMAEDLGPATTSAMPAFLAAFAAGQLVCGPLSDRCGRRKVLLGGLLIYVLASLLCGLAGDAWSLFLGRSLQGVGAASGLVVVRAVIRDLYEGTALARAMSITTLLYAAVPALAPLLGGILSLHFGWRASYFTLSALGFLLLAWLALSLPETRGSGSDVKGAGLRRTFAQLCRNLLFLRYATTTAALSGGLFAFLTAAPTVFIDSLGLTPAFFGVFPALTVPGFVVGATLGAWWAGRLHPDCLIAAGAALAGLGGCLMVLTDVWASLTQINITFALLLATSGLGLAMPAGNAAALESLGRDEAGAASALLGALQMLCAAGGSLASLLFAGQPGLFLGFGFAASWVIASASLTCLPPLAARES